MMIDWLNLLLRCWITILRWNNFNLRLELLLGHLFKLLGRYGNCSGGYNTTRRLLHDVDIVLILNNIKFPFEVLASITLWLWRLLALGLLLRVVRASLDLFLLRFLNVIFLCLLLVQLLSKIEITISRLIIVIWQVLPDASRSGHIFVDVWV